MTQLLNYVTEFQEKGVLHEFYCQENNWLIARQNAIELAEMLKSINEATRNHLGIKIYLEYVQDVTVLKHYILNGTSMRKEEILQALDTEHSILKAADLELEIMTGYAAGKTYTAVNQLYMKLCYFGGG